MSSLKFSPFPLNLYLQLRRSVVQQKHQMSHEHDAFVYIFIPAWIRKLEFRLIFSPLQHL